MTALLRRHFTSRSSKFTCSSNGLRVLCQICSWENPQKHLNRRDFCVYQLKTQHARSTDFLGGHIVQGSAVDPICRHFSSCFAQKKSHSQDSNRTVSIEDKSSSGSENPAEEETQCDPVELQARGKENQDVDFKTFYFFPHIRLIRLMCRMKLYQTGLTLLVCPLMTAGYCFDIVPLESLQSSASIAALALVVLYSTTYFTRRLVGMMSLNEDRKVVRFSHLTFFGDRSDVDVHINDVVPMSEVRGGSQLVRLEAYVDSEPDQTDSRQEKDKTLEYFFCSIKYGRITNEELYRYVFGSAA